MFLLFSHLIVIGCLFQITEETDPELEEPFLLPFGPKHGDIFVSKHYCTYQNNIYNLGVSLRFGSDRYENVSVCTDGCLYFNYEAVFYYEYDEYMGENLPHIRYSHSASIFPFCKGSSDMALLDNLLDYSCLADENYLDDEYLDVWHILENVCNWYRNEQEVIWWGLTDGTFRQYLDWNYISDENVRTLAEEWSNKTFSRDNFNVTTDDEITRAIMGNETTKYVNLANNVFRRQISDQEDLQKVSDVVVSCMGNSFSFDATWGYVVTWYKVGWSYSNPLEAFNSYQTILTCDDRQTSLDSDDKCYVIFDYYELQLYNAGRLFIDPETGLGTLEVAY